jgi:hypothetical protein
LQKLIQRIIKDSMKKIKFFKLKTKPKMPTSKPLNIVMLSKWDYAGSGWKIIHCVNNDTIHHGYHIKKFYHPTHGFPAQFIVSPQNQRKIQQLIDEADIIHFKGDNPPSRTHWDDFKIRSDKKIIISVSGSGFRRPPRGIKKMKIARAFWPMCDYLNKSDLRTAITPDLNYPEYNGIYTPEMIDSESIPYCWEERWPAVIGYYPSQDNRKGFDSHIGPALEILESEGYKFERLPTMGLSYQESVEIKKKMTVFIDSMTIFGSYGNSALEAMQFGIPVISYLSPQTLNQSKSEVFRKCPILNPGFSVAGLVFLLKAILDNKLNLNSISRQTKEYCDNLHGYSRNSKIWDTIYRGVFEGLTKEEIEVKCFQGG